VQGTVADADQSQDHRDFNGDREHAEERAYGTVGEVRDDELVEQASIIRASVQWLTGALFPSSSEVGFAASSSCWPPSEGEVAAKRR
jgi:hypothetical protein